MADTTHNEVFDRLSQSFKESNLGQSSVTSQSLLSTTKSAACQPAGKPDEKLLQYIRYKEWLDTVRRDHEAAMQARRVESTGNDQDQLNERILKLQQELLKESTNHSLKELALKRLQLSDTLLQTLFPASTSSQSTSKQRDKFRDLTSKQSELVTEVIGHQKVCQRVQEELDSIRKECLGIKRRNREVMSELLLQNEEKKQQASNHDNEKHQQVHGEISRILSHIQIGSNILQCLVVGSGVNWGQDDELKELMLSLGRPVEL